MSDHILVLHPVDPFASFDDVIMLQNHLRKIGFLGEKYKWFGDPHFLLGSEFFRFIKFDHSHTAILLEDSPNGLKEGGRSDSRYLCHIELPKVVPVPDFLGAANTLPPLCPNCNHKPTDNPFEVIGNWYANRTNFRWACPNCDRSFFIQELDWRKSAGFARQQIKIWEVQADEAVPTPEFFAFLETVTGAKWAHFYYHL